MLSSKNLHKITIAMLLFAAVASGLFLIRSAQPSADVLAKFDADHPKLIISDFEVGVPQIIELNQVAIIVWRRNAEDMALAKAQESQTDRSSFVSSVYDREVAPQIHDASGAANDEWFIAWAFGHWNCRLLLRTGDYDGFFDTCRGSHFDLHGRIRKGPSNIDLKIIPFKRTEDGKSLQLDISNIPKLAN